MFNYGKIGAVGFLSNLGGLSYSSIGLGEDWIIVEF